MKGLRFDADKSESQIAGEDLKPHKLVILPNGKSQIPQIRKEGRCLRASLASPTSINRFMKTRQFRALKFLTFP
ncbi:hypothetical protein EVAR_62769_1 [Eumeta japonica]|uniref:Uncharacterized protein n=1 Tax=Eumeta variegata TaxID=151549 RepID=A0A4C1ZLK4_EUMVA|nr:hypothetical protein EVAR_62769_1 [Eumeta japonica]